jgi:hypothetical protein
LGPDRLQEKLDGALAAGDWFLVAWLWSRIE